MTVEEKIRELLDQCHHSIASEALAAMLRLAVAQRDTEATTAQGWILWPERKAELDAALLKVAEEVCGEH